MNEPRLNEELNNNNNITTAFSSRHPDDVDQPQQPQRYPPQPNRKISSTSLGPFRKISDIISPERRISPIINPFYKPLEDESRLTKDDVARDGHHGHVVAMRNGDGDDDRVDADDDYIDERDEYEFDDDEGRGGGDNDGDGDSMDGDVRTDEDIEARRYCCGEARLNCGRFAGEMKKQAQEIKRSVKKIDAKKICKSFFSMNTLKRKLPIINWAPKYRMAEFQGDLVAGITVGLTVIPQSIAYAFMAGVPNETGLYSAFIGSFVYVFFGSSKDITLGPSAVSALLTAFFASSPIPKDPTVAIMLSFFVGLIEIGMFLINFGYFINFISFPVIKAFSVASAITIAASQVKKWFGLKGVPRDFMPQFYWTVHKLPETRLYDFLLGVVSIAIIVTLKKLKEIPWKTKYEELTLGKKILYNLVWFSGLGRNIVVIIGGSIVSFIFLQNGLRPFSLTGYITPGVPPFKVPTFVVTDPNSNKTYSLDYISTNVIGAGFIIVPLLGLLEAMAIGNVFARKFNYRIDPNQEYLAYGLGNLLTGFLGGMPITGTFSRTAVNAQCGVKTPAGGIWTGVVVLIAIQFCTPAMYYIPDASLAVVIFMAVLDMITFHKFWIFWNTNKIDVIPWLLTIILSFVISIAYGVIIGAAIAILLLLYPATKPKMKTVHEVVPSESTNNGSIILVTFNTGLMFPAIENMKDILIPLYSSAADLPRGVILDFVHVAYIDTTTVQGLRIMLENFNSKKIPLVICNLQKSVRAMLLRAKPKFLLLAESVEEANGVILNGPKKDKKKKNNKLNNNNTNFRNLNINNNNKSNINNNNNNNNNKINTTLNPGLDNPGYVYNVEDEVVKPQQQQY